MIYKSIEQSIGTLTDEVKSQVDAEFFKRLSSIYDKYYK